MADESDVLCIVKVVYTTSMLLRSNEGILLLF